MIAKPDICKNVDFYGYMTKWEYEDVAEDMDEVELEALNRLVTCAYKEGVRDGIFIAEELNTK